MRRCLLVVAKAPVAGLVKTRLAAQIGAERTVALYRCFLADSVAIHEQVADCALALSFWPPAAAPQFQQLYPNALLFPQTGDDFGSRLLSAFTQAAAAGFDEIVLIGSDNPSLPAAYVQQAFDALAHHPVVLGPSDDGGYYMIGMRQPHATLFSSQIAWSTAIVADQTRTAAVAANLSLAEAPIWYDIDTIADLRRLHDDIQGGRVHALQTGALLDLFACDGLADVLTG